MSQNCQLKRLVSKQEGELLSTASVHKKRKIDDSTGKYAMASSVGSVAVGSGSPSSDRDTGGGCSVRRGQRGSTTRGKVAAPAGYYVYVFTFFSIPPRRLKSRTILLHRRM